MRLTINEEKRIPNFIKKEIKKLALLIVPKNFLEIYISFVDKKRIIEINKNVFKKEKATDVITLTYPCAPEYKIGEVFICSDVAKENSKFFGISYECELLILAAHSFLHLNGLDDKSLDDFKKINKLTLINLKKLL